ncbi:aminoglycoside phosphotransferase family protein [Kribbella sp. NPDC051587]|uniref:aminoglycoside phosphotransferase family protein n=1 Tax=Kribbella sp. NPDC051587 TaxID=3364119 RepID=UPI0037A70252
MDNELISRIVESFSVQLRNDGPKHGLSGAGVYFATADNDMSCVLKVSSDVGSDGEWTAARRELEFYRSLSAHTQVRTPELLAVYEDDQAIGLLLSAEGLVRAAPSWSRQNWLDLVVDLARIHNSDLLDDGRWTDSKSQFDALLNPDLAMVEDFWREQLGGLLDVIFDSRTALQAAILAGGETFVHGDCHTENILVNGDGELVWIDWQSARIGSASRDLAFLDARATPSGAGVPADVLVKYCESRGLDSVVMRRSVVAAELAVFIFEWPPYASYDTPVGTQRVRRRARDLAAEWCEIAGLDWV